MFNPGWGKAIAALVGIAVIALGAGVICSGGDTILGVCTIIGGLILATDPLGG